ncbi:hypothetical protein KO494_11530 [Lacinutrix sp. C3R15]|uniref:hypothetical protein n=1 Tax=Flavobacteriaceae TaxID=49546 RepID=UPI001C087251|nr:MULTISPECIES: hypothetical protein [Flavobacteriaceae]MBU2940167.1 hypothetical protein [Lacinutrix sp. C3R15]MDO6623484.1 hypothetical protein [Oceanihabitans sp. 1_MG-2023]
MSDNPLLEVRKAYRLLFDYQSRILDLMKFIGQTYNIPFVKGHPKFSGRGSNKLNNWSWDWLYMYYYAFHFNNTSVKDKKIYLSVYLLNDSGFFEVNYEKAEANDKKVEHLEVDQFKDVENSKTKLIFVAGQNEWNWWNEVKHYSKEFILNTQGQAKNSNMVWKGYDLDLFFTEEEALMQLQDFSTYCINNNIAITIEDK